MAEINNNVMIEEFFGSEENTRCILDLTKVKNIQLSMRSIGPFLSFAASTFFYVPVTFQLIYKNQTLMLQVTAYLKQNTKYKINLQVDPQVLFNLLLYNRDNKHDITTDLIKDTEYESMLIKMIELNNPEIIYTLNHQTKQIALFNGSSISCIAQSFDITAQKYIQLNAAVGTWNTEFKINPDQTVVLCLLDTGDCMYVKFADLESKEPVLAIVDAKTPDAKKLDTIIAQYKAAAKQTGISLEQYVVNQIYTATEEKEVLDF